MTLTYRTRNGDVENAFGMGKVFVSYKKPRIRLCKRVTEDILNSVNCAVWYDRNLTPGAQYDDEIAAAIDEANAFVLLVGYETFDEEGYVMKKELPRALARRIPVIPVVIDNDEELIKKADELLEQRHMLKMSEPEEYMQELERVLRDTILSEDEQENVIKAFTQDGEGLGKTEYFRGVGYLKGLNTEETVVERDPDRALSLLRSSAENYGYLDAMLLIADMYNDGNGVRRSVDEALSWLDKAIEKQGETGDLKLDEACQLDKALEKKSSILSYLGRYTEAAAAHEARLTMWREYKGDEPEAQQNLAIACDSLGIIYLFRFSRIEKAKLLFSESLAFTEKLAEASPDSAEVQRNLSINYNRLGDVCMEQGDLPGARDYYQKALTICQRLAEASPDSAEVQRDLSISYNRLGSVCVKQGDLSRARKYYQKYLEISQKLAEVSPDSAEAQRDLSISYENFGDVCMRQDDLPGARDYYQKGLAIRQKLAEASPDSAEAQRDLSISYNRLGNVCVKQGDLPGAKDYYQKALETSQKLAEVSPDSAEVQGGLWAGYNRLGEVCIRLGDLLGARDYYQKGLEISKKLVGASPDSAVAQRDLSISYNKLGDVCMKQSNLSGARDYYQKGLAIRQKLAEASPDSAEAQRDLSISYNKLGDVCVAQGNLSGARDYYQKGLDIRQKLAGASPDSAVAQRDLSISDEKLGDVCMKQSNLSGSRDYYQKGLDIRQKLAGASPDSAVAQRDLSVIYEKLGDVCMAQGDLPGAGDCYQKSLRIRQKLAETSLDSAEAQNDLAVSYYKVGTSIRNMEMLEKAAKIWTELYEKTKTALYKEWAGLAEKAISPLRIKVCTKTSAAEEHTAEPQPEPIKPTTPPQRRSLWWLWLLIILAVLTAVGFGLDRFGLVDFSELLSFLN